MSEPQLPFVLLSVSMCVDPWDCECAALGGGAPQGTFSLVITKGRLSKEYIESLSLGC